MATGSSTRCPRQPSPAGIVLRMLVLGAVVFGWFGACRTEPGTPQTVAAPRQTYGAPIVDSGEKPLGEVLAHPSDHQGKTVLVTGDVRKACSIKGCWMELAAPGASAPPASNQGCRVTFKDYAFFVPVDAAGSRARVSGIVQVRTLPKAEVDHLEGEGARFASKNPDGTAAEVHIVASGVELWRDS